MKEKGKEVKAELSRRQYGGEISRRTDKFKGKRSFERQTGMMRVTNAVRDLNVATYLHMIRR
jgi:hypothetical protein